MKKQRIVLRFIMLLAFMLVGVMLHPTKPAFAAATAVKVASVEYYEDQIVVLNNGNSKIYYATDVEAAKNNWEAITPDTGLFTMIDISYLSPTVENILVIKGEENSTQSRIILNARPMKLEVSINYANIDSMSDSATIAPLVNIMTTVGDGATPVNFDDLEWRKGTSGQWASTKSLTVGLLKKYLVKGTFLYFRIRALDDYVTVKDSAGTVINLNNDRILGIQGGIRRYETLTTLNFGTDFPNGTKGRRFSNEVKVKVVKKSTAMVYGIDGEKFTAEIKYGKEYRVTIGSTTTNWVQVTDRTVKSLPLSTVINNSTIDGTIKANAFPKMKIEIRDYATSKAASSKITEINLNAQRTINNNIIPGKAPTNATTPDDNIYVYYNGNKNMVITIPKASPNLPYEFCVAKPGETFDITKVVWTSVTKGTEVKILASKAVDGGTLYVRQKEIKSQAATSTQAAIGYELASTYVTQAISYPSTPVITATSYTFTKGYSSDITFTVTLNVAGKTPFETAVKSIKLGTKDIDYSAPPYTTSGNVSTLTITLKATSLATLTNCYNKPITITFMNGTVDKSSIKLTIQNSAPAGALTVTNAMGTNTGTTSFTMVSSKAAADTWSYVITSSAISSATTMDKISVITTATATAFTTTTVDNITVTANQYITIFETDTAGNIVKYKSILITADMIKP